MTTVEYCGDAELPQTRAGFSITCEGNFVHEPHSGRGTACADIDADGRLEIPEGATLRDDVFFQCDSLTTVEYCGDAEVPQTRAGFPITCEGNFIYEKHTGRGATCADVDADGRLEFTGGALPDYDDVSNKSPFYQCTALVTLILPDEITSVGTMAFFLCTSLTSIEFPAGLATIGSGAFAGSPLVSVEIPEGLTYIPAGAFSSYRNVTFKIPDSVATIAANAFRDPGSSMTITLIYCGLATFDNQPPCVLVACPDDCMDDG
eukprot:SAG22_NODE_4600_length_1220_cov_1.711864_1_plen_261_part_10